MADGTLKVGTITNSAGSGNIAIGSGVTLLSNVPAFEAYSSAFQGIANNTYVKAQFNTEVFDTDNAYDNSTNYRFTVPTGKGGKYFITAQLALSCNSGNNLQNTFIAIYVKIAL